MSNKDYLKELRKIRQARFQAALNRNNITSEEIIATHGKEVLEKLRKNYFSGVTRIQNRTRGRRGELIASIAVEHIGLCKFSDLQRDCVTFATPFGGRRFDLFYNQDRVAIEAKSGRIYLSKKIRGQIDKDRYLLTNDSIKRVIWILCYGGSENFMNYAERSGIEIWELDANDRDKISDLFSKTLYV